jgi:hypothetical protein
MIVTVGVNRPGPSTAQRPGQMRPRPQATPISRTPKLALPSAVNGAQAANFESMPAAIMPHRDPAPGAQAPWSRQARRGLITVTPSRPFAGPGDPGLLELVDMVLTAPALNLPELLEASVKQEAGAVDRDDSRRDAR